MIEQLTAFLLQLVEQLGYIGIFIATLIESTFIPIPAEVTMLPAGILVGRGDLNYWGVLLVSTSGVVLGSCINYWIGYRFGRGFILRFGRFFFLKAAFLDKVEIFFQQHGTFAAFSGRLIPGVRHYIAFPAGMARMRFRPFFLCTLAGGMIWMWTLLHLGYEAGKKAGVDGKVDMKSLEDVVIILVVILLVLYGARLWLVRRQRLSGPRL